MRLRIKFVGNKKKTMDELSELCIEKGKYLVIDKVETFTVRGR